MSYEIEGVAEELEEVLVGRRIVSAEKLRSSEWYGEEYLALTLDNGAVVEVYDEYDCCAYAAIDGFLLDPNSVDHIITSVRSDEDHTEFFVLADMQQVLKLDTSWDEGNGYYSYGLTIKVREAV